MLREALVIRGEGMRRWEWGGEEKEVREERERWEGNREDEKWEIKRERVTFSWIKALDASFSRPSARLTNATLLIPFSSHLLRPSLVRVSTISSWEGLRRRKMEFMYGGGGERENVDRWGRGRRKINSGGGGGGGGRNREVVNREGEERCWEAVNDVQRRGWTEEVSRREREHRQW